MAHYHVHGLIPDGISQAEGYKMFEQYIASGAPMDNFEGFELISRLHAPETGEVFVTFKEETIAPTRRIERPNETVPGEKSTET